MPCQEHLLIPAAQSAHKVTRLGVHHAVSTAVPPQAAGSKAQRDGSRNPATCSDSSRVLPSLHPLRNLSALYRRTKKTVRLFIARSSSNKGQIPGGNNRSVATASINTRHHCDSFVEWEPVLLTGRSQRQKQFVNSFWLTLYWAMGRRINHPIIMPLEKSTCSP